MTKRPIKVTIENELVDKVDKYIERKKEITGSAPSRSAIIEEGLSRNLIRLEKDLEELVPEKGRRISIVK